MTRRTLGVQSGGLRANRSHRTQTNYGQKYLDNRSEIKSKGTITDHMLGEEYRQVWNAQSKFKDKQKTLTDITTIGNRKISFERVESGTAAAEKWKFIADHFHYVPHSPHSIKPYGRFLRYFIKLEAEVIGIIAVTGSFLSLGDRDRYIGWNEEQRLKNNKKMAHNIVYCILPNVNIPNLSSQILSKFVKVVRHDWKVQYGDTLVAMDTLVDPNLYRGISYIAAGWVYVGMTKGFGSREIRKDIKGYGAANIGRILFKHNIPKMILIKPLHRYWRKELCR